MCHNSGPAFLIVKYPVQRFALKLVVWKRLFTILEFTHSQYFLSYRQYLGTSVPIHALKLVLRGVPQNAAMPFTIVLRCLESGKIY